MRGSARSRRTPQRVGGGGGRRFPWVPIVIVVGVAVVVALIGYLIVQAGQEPGGGFDEAANWERGGEDGQSLAADPNLPGEYVNLPEIYKDGETLAAYGGENDAPNTASHVTRDVDYSDQGLPPAGGPHWGSGACPPSKEDAQPFCGPVQWGRYREPDTWDAESLVHNMEHAGIVIWYDTDDQELIAELEDFADDNDDRLLVLTPYPEMEDETVAITVWARRLQVPAAEFDRDAFQDFIGALACKFDPEDFC